MLAHPHLADDSTTRQKKGAIIVFLDEAGIGVMTRSGRTRGEVNTPPIVPEGLIVGPCEGPVGFGGVNRILPGSSGLTQGGTLVT